MSGVPCSRCSFVSGEIVGNKYIIDKPLGEGAFGIVYRVKDKANGKTHALKLLKLWEVESCEREKLLKRFDLEYETGQIKSDYLVQSLDRGEAEGNPYFVMEYCSGGDVNNALSSNDHFNLERCATHILLGLRTLHENGKVHRDLKPENVLVKEDGTSALTDFGISGDRNKRLTERGIAGNSLQIFGTYAYMPPEQINPRRGDATVLPTTDIFSFGVMMYQLITNNLPFGPLNNEADLYNYVNKGKNGQWNKSLLLGCKDGAKWLSAIEGCLIPDFKTRLQTTDEVLRLIPKCEGLRPENINPDSSNIQQAVNGYLLRIMQGEEYGKVYKLNEIMKANNSFIITLGRNTEGIRNTIAIKEEESRYISRMHSTLEFDFAGEKWLIRDGQWNKHAYKPWINSTNGTYVGSKEIDFNGVYLNVGDIISVGDVKLRVEGY